MTQIESTGVIQINNKNEYAEFFVPGHETRNSNIMIEEKASFIWLLMIKADNTNLAKNLAGELTAYLEWIERIDEAYPEEMLE